MKKATLLLMICSCLLTGCTAKAWKTAGAVTLGTLMLGSYAYGEWHAQKLDDYVRQNGVPTSSYQTSDGNVIYSFIRPCENTPGYEEKMLTVDENNTIKNETLRHACPVV